MPSALVFRHAAPAWSLPGPNLGPRLAFGGRRPYGFHPAFERVVLEISDLVEGAEGIGQVQEVAVWIVTEAGHVLLAGANAISDCRPAAGGIIAKSVRYTARVHGPGNAPGGVINRAVRCAVGTDRVRDPSSGS